MDIPSLNCSSSIDIFMTQTMTPMLAECKLCINWIHELCFLAFQQHCFQQGLSIHLNNISQNQQRQILEILYRDNLFAGFIGEIC